MAKSRTKNKVTHPNGSQIDRKSRKVNPTLDMITNLNNITLTASSLIQRTKTKAESSGLKNYEIPILTRQLKTLSDILSDQMRLSIEMQKHKIEILGFESLNQLEDKTDEEILRLLGEAQKEIEEGLCEEKKNKK